MTNLKQIGRNEQEVKRFWRAHGLHALTGEAYQKRRGRAIYTHNWMAIIRACINLGELEPGKRVLEVGCGWGRILVGLKEMLPQLQVYGIDLVHELIQHAREVVPTETGSTDVQLSVGDAQILPIKTDSFDAAISARVLQYVPDPVRALGDIARVVRPGGKVVVLLPNKFNPIRWYTYPARLYGPLEIRKWFETAGLQEIDTRSICFSPTWPRQDHHSRLLIVETLQKVPIINYLGGLAVVSGRKAG